ncbi:MAG: exodeoxyribonuclease III [Deltaproteobacteria bacterium]|nr:exodeoxyribonuclease III [Deltaproteobacteria bacterium]
MRIATWNVNSVRIRQERLLAWLGRHQPDLLCLQELKAVEAEFPWQAVADAGYQAAVVGQKTYNGVAVLTKQPCEVLAKTWTHGDEDPQARLLDVRFGGVRVLSLYVPNGSEVDSDKFVYKRAWLDRLIDHLERTARPDELLALCGDFNIAPTDLDARNPAAWRDSVLCCDAIRGDWQRLLGWGLTDVVRQIHPTERLYSWWDYRNLGFIKNDGLRIDHVLATAPLAALAQTAFVDRDERKGGKPSDHAPVVVDFALPT